MSEERVMSEIVWTPERGLSEPEVRGVSWNNLLVSDDSYGIRHKTASGIQITPEKALQSTVFLSCCRLLAEIIACMPLHVYRKLPNGYREIAHEIPLYEVLHSSPNSWQNKMEFIEQMMMTLTGWGNSYTEIESGLYGSVTNLHNLHPSRMQVERLENGRLRYSYNNPQTGKLERYNQDQIMHIRWTAEPDGIKGMVPTEISRDAIALARALEIYASGFWANSARPGVILQTDGSLTTEAAERLRDNFERLHRGVYNAYRTAVLTNGLKVEPIGFSNEQAQFSAARTEQTAEICRVFRIPLHLIQGDSSGDLEQKGQDFLTYTLTPWLHRLESGMSRSLIINRREFVVGFDTSALVRADSNRRASYYGTMLGLGLMNINEARKHEGLPPIGPRGDNYFVAMNQQTIEDAAKPKPDPSQMPGAPQPAIGGIPSQPDVPRGAAPAEAEQGQASEAKSQNWEDAIDVTPERRSDDGCGREDGGTFAAGNSCQSKSGSGKSGQTKTYPPIKQNDPSLVRHKPFVSVGDSRNSDFIRIPSDEELSAALRDANGDEKAGDFGAARDLEHGYPVSFRIDIPTFTKSVEKGVGVYAVTVHEQGLPSRGKVGPRIGYDSIARLSGPVQFNSLELGATKVAQGKTTKNPFATVSGGFDRSRELPKDIDKWTPVGYDPEKSAYFYDKRTGKEVLSGTDAVSVGNTVFVRKPKYGKRKAQVDYRSADDCGRVFGGKFGPGNKCQADGVGGGGGGYSSTSSTKTSDSSGNSIEGPDGKIDARKLLAKIAENPQGFTLDRKTAEQPEDGIVVCEFRNDDEERSMQVMKDDIQTDETAKRLEEFLEDNEDAFAGRTDRYLGGWMNEGKFYFDISTRFNPDQGKEALEAGRKSHQFAVFNLGTFKTTHIKYARKELQDIPGWGKSYKSSLKESDADGKKELKKHGWTTVRSLALSNLIAAGYTPENARKAIEDFENEQRQIHLSGQGRHPTWREQERGILGVPEVCGEGGGGERQGDGSVLVQQVPEGRADDCERDELGRFGAGNDCASGGGVATAPEPLAGVVPQIGGVPSDPDVLRTYNIISGSSDPIGVVAEAIAKSGYSPGMVRGISVMATHPERHATAAILTEMATSSASIDPAIVETPSKTIGLSGMIAGGVCGSYPQAKAIPAFYETDNGTINLNTGATQTAIEGIKPGRKSFIVNKLSHYLVHEQGHALHFENLRKSAGLSSGQLSDEEYEKLRNVEDDMKRVALRQFMTSSSLRNYHANQMSEYGRSMPGEFVAEYYSHVMHGGARDPAADKFVEAMGFPIEELDKRHR